MSIGSRIEYIDLLKGMAMMLVFYGHIAELFYDGGHGIDECYMIHLPVFFFVSGFLFSPSLDWKKYLIKRFYGIIVPFVFFWIVLSNIIPCILKYLGGASYQQWDISWLYWGIYREQMIEEPLWYLVATFWASLMFYLLYYIIVFKCGRNYLFFCCAALGVGILGFILGYSAINLPAYLDSAMSSLFFYAIGYLCRKSTYITLPNKNDIWIMSILLVASYLIHHFHAHVLYMSNSFPLPWGILLLTSIIGVLGMFYIAKLIKYIPMVNKIGEFSILPLCCQLFVIRYVCSWVTAYWDLSSWTYVFVIFILTTCFFLLLIPIWNKYLPFTIGKYKKITR